MAQTMHTLDEATASYWIDVHRLHGRVILEDSPADATSTLRCAGCGDSLIGPLRASPIMHSPYFGDRAFDERVRAEVQERVRVLRQRFIDELEAMAGEHRVIPAGQLRNLLNRWHKELSDVE